MSNETTAGQARTRHVASTQQKTDDLHRVRCPDCDYDQIVRSRPRAINRQQNGCPNCNRGLGVQRVPTVTDGGHQEASGDDPDDDPPLAPVCVDEHGSVKLITDGGRSSPSDMTLREARDRFLSKIAIDKTDKTIRSYRNRLTRFVEWADRNGLDAVNELDGYVLDTYQQSLRGDSKSTIKGKMMAVKQLIGYLEQVEAVEQGLEDKVPIPTLSSKDERSEKQLAPDAAIALLTFYRDSAAYCGTPGHTTLEILWHTGCRMSGLRALDMEDYDPDGGVLSFQNRPDTGTRLKNGDDGERPVAIPPEVVDVLDEYIARERFDKHDDHGRRPLLSCRQDRPSETTIRNWAYQATQPCLHKQCPHGRRKQTCDYRERNFASQCPSSRSPHQVRTGSITWQLNRGIPIEDVAERVNSSPDVIRRHYDVATGVEKMEERRQQYLENLSLDG